MNRKYGASVFIGILFVIVSIVVGHSFLRYYVIKDYPLSVFTVCNPEAHNCFEVVEDTGLAFQSEPYAKVEITAMYAPSCLGEHSCSDFSCDGVSGMCNITFCSEDTRESGEVCSGDN